MVEESRAQADVHVAQNLGQRHLNRLADQRIQLVAEHVVQLGIFRGPVAPPSRNRSALR
jgi:hypothetical protein